jgi:hypothetical protein
MKLLSCDIGIRNLSFCLFELDINDIESAKILKWGNVNLTNDNDLKCVHLDKKGICNKEAKFMNKDQCYCTKHAKLHPYIQPCAELKSSALNKLKIDSLKDIATKYNVTISHEYRKKDILNAINSFIDEKCYVSIVKSNASKTTGATLARNIATKVDDFFGDTIESIDLLIIENQLANKMATIQGMITQYFVMRNSNINVEVISATNKLKDVSNDTGPLTYNGRKKLGISACLDMVVNDERFKEWEEFVASYKKKDDLADSFLQGLWYIKYKLF